MPRTAATSGADACSRLAPAVAGGPAGPRPRARAVRLTTESPSTRCARDSGRSRRCAGEVGAGRRSGRSRRSGRAEEGRARAASVAPTSAWSTSGSRRSAGMTLRPATCEPGMEYCIEHGLDLWRPLFRSPTRRRSSSIGAGGRGGRLAAHRFPTRGRRAGAPADLGTRSCSGSCGRGRGRLRTRWAAARRGAVHSRSRPGELQRTRACAQPRRGGARGSTARRATMSGRLAAAVSERRRRAAARWVGGRARAAGAGAPGSIDEPAPAQRRRAVRAPAGGRPRHVARGLGSVSARPYEAALALAESDDADGGPPGARPASSCSGSVPGRRRRSWPGGCASGE